jgi:prepilin-type processing-associated H-X9-DG protein
VAIIAVLVAMLLPGIQKAREQSFIIQCKSNLKSLHLAVEMYATDWNDFIIMPYRKISSNPDKFLYWRDFLGPYIANMQSFYCPRDKVSFKGKTTGYGHNYYELGHDGEPKRRSKILVPDRIFLLADNNNETTVFGVGKSWNQYFIYPDGFGSWVTRRHQGGLNVLWIDGHVTWEDAAFFSSYSPYWYPSCWH